jgi:hypothetical protein
LSSRVEKMRYGIAWRKGAVEEVVARFVQYVKQQFRDSKKTVNSNE